MNTGTVAARYARALLKFALENGQETAVYEEMAILRQRLGQVREIHARIVDPTVSDGNKVKLLETAIWDGRQKASDSTMRFLGLVVGAGRADILLFMANGYMEQFRKLKGIVPVHLITATEVGDERRERMSRLVSRLTDWTPEWTHTMDPSIEGGFVLQVGGYRLDASVAGQLQKIRKELIEKNNRVI